MPTLTILILVPFTSGLHSRCFLSLSCWWHLYIGFATNNFHRSIAQKIHTFLELFLYFFLRMAPYTLLLCLSFMQEKLWFRILGSLKILRKGVLVDGSEVERRRGRCREWVVFIELVDVGGGWLCVGGLDRGGRGVYYVYCALAGEGLSGDCLVVCGEGLLFLVSFWHFLALERWVVEGCVGLQLRLGSVNVHADLIEFAELFTKFWVYYWKRTLFSNDSWYSSNHRT